MERFEGREGINEFSIPPIPNQFHPKPTGDALFDASQYAFFGNDVVEEVELGGLEDEEDDGHPTAFTEEEYQLDGEEVQELRSLTEADDLACTFSNLNKVASGSLNAGFTGDGPSRESSSVAEWVQDGDYPSWGQPHFDGEGLQVGKRLPSRPYSSSPGYMDSKDLYRTSSYPEQPQQYPPQHQQQLHHHYSSEPVIIPKSSFTSYPSPGGSPGGRPLQGSPNSQYHQSNVTYHPGGVREMLPPSPNRTPFSIPQRQLTSLQHGSNLGGNLPQFSQGPPVNSRLQNQFLGQTGMYHGDHSNLPSNMMRPNLPNHNGLLPPQLTSQQQLQQQRLHPQFQPSFPHMPGLQSQILNHHLSTSPQMMRSFDLLGSGDMRDARPRSLVKGGQNLRFSQGLDINSQRSENGWPRYKSKYMTADEIENILRMQLAATHSNDPYTDDYYHQGCLAKKSSGSKLRHHFCPNFLRDGPSTARANNEPHPFLQVDALGRVAFSSVRRPRPLVEVDPPNSSGNGSNEQKVFEKPLEQEPMLAARVIIEDGLCLLLDVDDIDRFLQFNQLQDNGIHLRKRRQELMEDLAASLQVVDPLVKNGYSVALAPKDDVVFLRLLSLSKGRKLLSKYLKLLPPGDELVRIICMAIHRHLRFLFGALPADTKGAETTVDLSKTVSFCVNGLDLKALAACLASVVCSEEPPPLRPIGSPAGDGASVVVRSVLERATELFRDPRASGNCSVPNRGFWQVSFDAFFDLLTKYCFSKYDTVMQSITMQSLDASSLGSDVARAISREMPVELLRASLPHTSEQQKKLLLDFAKRTMPVTQGFNGAGEQSNGS